MAADEASLLRSWHIQAWTDLHQPQGLFANHAALCFTRLVAREGSRIMGAGDISPIIPHQDITQAVSCPIQPREGVRLERC